MAVIFVAKAFQSVANEYFEGDGTSYTLGQISSGNCNFMSAVPSAKTNYVALNQAQWDNLGGCGRCLEVSCIDKRCKVQNKTAVVQVLDRCPECAFGALDLSPTVYKEITGMDPNRLRMRWKFVECPNPGTLQVCLKDGSNPNWMAVQPANGLVGVQSVTVNGATTSMLDGAYYYVSSKTGANLAAVEVSVTSIQGEKISGTYSLAAGKCTDTATQFGSSSVQRNPTLTSATPIQSITEPYDDIIGGESDSSFSSESSQITNTSTTDSTSQMEQTSPSSDTITQTINVLPSPSTNTPASPATNTPEAPHTISGETNATTTAPTNTLQDTGAALKDTGATPTDIIAVVLPAFDATDAPSKAPTKLGVATSKCRVKTGNNKSVFRRL